MNYSGFERGNAMKLTFALLLLIACVPLALAQGTYTQIDPPGATSTEVHAIDTNGDIAGWYATDSGLYGFVLSGGAYTSIVYPGPYGTFVFGMNDNGQLVGYAQDSTTLIGFQYDIATQTFTEINFPEALYTEPAGINDAGVVIGTFEPQHGTGSGFVLQGHNYSRIHVPGSESSTPSGITTAGEIVGTGYFPSRSPNEASFLFNNGKYQIIKLNDGFSVNYVTGVSKSGNALVWDGPLSGYLFSNDTLQTLQFPGAPSGYTFTAGVNDSEEVVGWFVDSSGVTHGFTWTPPAAEAKR